MTDKIPVCDRELSKNRLYGICPIRLIHRKQTKTRKEIDCQDNY